MFIEAWLACRISSNSTEIATHKKLTHFIFSNKLFFLISLFFWKFVFFKNRKHQMIFTGILYIEYLFQKTLPRALEIFFSNIFRFFSTKRFRCSQQTKIFNATFFEIGIWFFPVCAILARTVGCFGRTQYASLRQWEQKEQTLAN